LKPSSGEILKNRRKVIAQILDYAKDLASWSYEELNAAVMKSEAPSVAKGQAGKAAGLYPAVVSFGETELDEGRFVDSIARNLRLGRFLLLIVGDGIQDGTEGIASYLQQHAGMHFTLALVELAIFALPEDGRFLVQPRIPTRTTNIDRGIVTFHDGRIAIEAQPPTKSGLPPTTGGKRTSITEERFYEELGAHFPEEAVGLQKLVERLAPLGITTDFGAKSLILRWRPDESRAWNLASFITDGKVWTDQLHSQADAVNLVDLSHRYVEHIAAAIPGAYVKKTAGKAWHVDKDGTYVKIDDLLSHSEAFIEPVGSFTKAASAALKD
jgi:hypothetical protein